MKFVYTVWFRNPSLPPEDQDHEWPACFVVESATEQAALAWGDHLARRYGKKSGQLFVSSRVEAADDADLPGVEMLPLVSDGQDATDDEIGW